MYRHITDAVDRVHDVTVTAMSSSSMRVAWRLPPPSCSKFKYCLTFLYHERDSSNKVCKLINCVLRRVIFYVYWSPLWSLHDRQLTLKMSKCPKNLLLYAIFYHTKDTGSMLWRILWGILPLWVACITLITPVMQQDLSLM